MYYAHTKENTAKSEWQPLKEHLENVALKARDFAANDLKNSSYLVGLLHDVGKYQNSFVKKLEGSNIRVDHSICGAKLILDMLTSAKYRLELSYIYASVVAGHHAGLPDFGSTSSDSDSSCLKERLKNKCEDYSAYKAEIGDKIDIDSIKTEIQAALKVAPNEILERYEFIIRHLYSCLVDADYLDTEEFCKGYKRNNINADWAKCELQLENKLRQFEPKTPVQKARKSLQNQALSVLEKHLTDASIYLLNMPTGSGKTLCSAALALRLVRQLGLKRIIYVIPYTSVIEQTAQVMQDIFTELQILQHHSGFDYNEIVEEKLKNKVYSDGINSNEIIKQHTENWDAPFIITTNVQFFESIYSNRSSKLRKLHNMSDSVIIFDEMHTLPIKHFIYCMRALSQLTKHYNSKAILMTATMPDYKSLWAKYVGNDISMCDLIPDKNLYSVFEKCRFEYLKEVDLLKHIDTTKNNLIVFNTKTSAEEYYTKYNGKKYHLSTFMTPKDRTKVIEEIKEVMKNGKEKIVVFSTSLIEAGVDLDFECVYRELSGLENILQTAGRCNREGKLSKDDSVTYIFTTDKLPRGELSIKAELSKGILENDKKVFTKISNIVYYYNSLYYNRDWIMKGREKPSWDINFKSKAEEFKFIETTTVGVVIPCEDIKIEIEQLETGKCNYRKLGKYSATVSFYQLKELLSQGVVSECNGIFILQSPEYYDAKTGIKFNFEHDYFY